MLRKLLVVCMGMAMLVAAGCGAKDTQAGNNTETSKEQTVTTIGTSSTGSIYNVIAVGMADIISRNTGVNASAVTTGGADATLNSIGDKKTDFGVVHTW
jgi:TRAP-type uncharacterized transport system substrate-binding protein